MKQFKGTPGQWALCGRHIQAPNSNGGTLQLGQSFVMEVPRHENKFTEDVEGLANAQLFAASKQMLEALQEMVILWESISTVMKPLINEEGYLKAKAALSAALD